MWIHFWRLNMKRLISILLLLAFFGTTLDVQARHRHNSGAISFFSGLAVGAVVASEIASTQRPVVVSTSPAIAAQPQTVVVVQQPAPVQTVVVQQPAFRPALPPPPPPPPYFYHHFQPPPPYPRRVLPPPSHLHYKGNPHPSHHHFRP